MEKTYTLIEWLEELSNSIAKIGKTEPFCAIWLISCGIEFIGKYIPINGTVPKGCRQRFDNAISNIPALREYKKYHGNLYNDLRCNLAHTVTPAKGLFLRAQGDNVFDKTNNRYVISFQKLNKDFANAILQLKEKKVPVVPGTLDNAYISVIEDNEGTGSAMTGNTESVSIKFN